MWHLECSNRVNNERCGSEKPPGPGEFGWLGADVPFPGATSAAEVTYSTEVPQPRQPAQSGSDPLAKCNSRYDGCRPTRIELWIRRSHSEGRAGDPRCRSDPLRVPIASEGDCIIALPAL